MIEAEWLASASPLRMLEHVAPRISERKLRLLALACWALCSHYRHYSATVAEAYDDFERGAIGGVPVGVTVDNMECVRRFIVDVNEWGPGTIAAQRLNDLKPHLLRCIAGNPWRPVALPGHRWISRFGRCSVCTECGLEASSEAEVGNRNCPGQTPRLTPAVLAIAQSIYDERRFEEMPVLADALEDAGCPATVKCPYCSAGHIRTRLGYYECGDCDTTGRIPHPLLAHLRDPGPHARGCWGLDCILGKE